MVDIIIRQARRKLGLVDDITQQRISLLSLEQLEELSEALLEFTSHTDLLEWLDRPLSVIAPQ